MRRLMQLAGHGLGVLGAALGIESLAGSLLPSLVRVVPFGLRLLTLRAGGMGMLGGAMVLIGALLIWASTP